MNTASQFQPVQTTRHVDIGEEKIDFGGSRFKASRALSASSASITSKPASMAQFSVENPC
jgi:hypothetical protein